MTGRWIWTASGVALAGCGFFGLLADARGPGVFGWTLWIVSGAVVHDGVLLPIVLLAGFLVGRWVSPRWRGPLRAGLVVSGMVTVVALPFVLGLGRTADLPSALPLDYGRGLLITVGVVWAAVLVIATAHLLRPGASAPTVRTPPARPTSVE